MWIIIICACVLFLAALLGFFILPGRPQESAKAIFRGVNHAHRGLHNESRPENSLPAFQAAAEAGYGIELDVQLSQDGQVMVFHDDELDRLCGEPGRMDMFTSAELQVLSLLGTEERIPLFQEVLDCVAGRVPLIVELKTGSHNDELCRKTLALLADYEGSYCIESFDPRIVAWFRRHAPHILRGQLSAPPKVFNMGLVGCIAAWGFSSFMGRPQFIAYQAVRRPLTIVLAQRLSMSVTWTLTPELDVKRFEGLSDAVIFEGYLPSVKYK